MNKTILIIVVVLIVVVGGYFLLRGGYQAPTQAPTPAPGVSPETVEEKIAPGETTGVTEPEEVLSEGREFTVSGSEYSFSPSLITVKAGEQVKITFKNTGRLIHNLIVEGLAISTKTIGGGKSDIIEFTAPASGTYTFFCSVPGHRASGMTGSLIVE